MGLFDSFSSLMSDCVDIVATPVDVVVSVASAAVNPVAEVAQELANDIKETLK